MKARIFLAIVLSLLFVASSAQAKPYSSLKLYAHAAAKPAEGGSVSFAAWTLAPNITQTPETWITLAGPRYNGKGWYVELLVGGLISKGDVDPTVDTNFEFTQDLTGLPIYIWGDAEYSLSGVVYTYLMVDYAGLSDKFMVGIENENLLFTGGPNQIGLGPNLMFTVGPHDYMVSYQFLTNQFVVRAFLRF